MVELLKGGSLDALSWLLPPEDVLFSTTDMFDIAPAVEVGIDRVSDSGGVVAVLGLSLERMRSRG